MSYLSEIERLEDGQMCAFFGRERNTPWATVAVEVTAFEWEHPSINRTLKPTFRVIATHYDEGRRHALQREFTQAKYAAEWIDGHLIRYTIEVKAPCIVCSQPCDFGSRGDGPATQEFGLDGSSFEFCGPACLKAWEVEA